MVKNSKKGSYIVEAAMSLPIFILVFVALALVVNIISSCEEMVFNESHMIYEMDMKAPQMIPRPDKAGYKVTGFRYLYSENGIDDLISVKAVKDHRVENPIGIMGRIEFELGIMSRAYTGSLDRSGPLEEGEFTEGGPSEIVTVFPKYGIRFHADGCRYLKQDFCGEEVKLRIQRRDAELKGYTPCLVCGGG